MFIIGKADLMYILKLINYHLFLVLASIDGLVFGSMSKHESAFPPQVAIYTWSLQPHENRTTVRLRSQ